MSLSTATIRTGIASLSLASTQLAGRSAMLNTERTALNKMTEVLDPAVMLEVMTRVVESLDRTISLLDESKTACDDAVRNLKQLN